MVVFQVKKFCRVSVTGNYAVVTICKEPVNSMDYELWSELGIVLKELEADDKVHGAIFETGLKKDVFTSGNDINELYIPGTTKQRFVKFWTAQTMFLVNLYRSPLITIAAIRGACPAGGCIVALCCDYRIQTDIPGAVIGLNEVALGIGVPRYWTNVMAALIGGRQTETLLLTAAMPKAAEAHRMGLIDKLVTKEELMPAATKVMESLLKFPRSGQILTKTSLRMDLAKQWEEYCAEEAETVYGVLAAPNSVKALGGVLQRLSKNKLKSKM